MAKTKEEILALQKRAAAPKNRRGRASQDARKAQRILDSLKVKPVHKEPGFVQYNNKQVGLTGSNIEGEIIFEDNKTSTKRPGTKTDPLTKLGKEAAIHRVVDSVEPGDVYSFSPIRDSKDMRKETSRGKPTNQRASLYARSTKGAFGSDRIGKSNTYVGEGERIDKTTWRPYRGPKKFEEVKFDPTAAVRRLGAIGAASRFAVGSQDPRVQLYIMADTLMKETTGTGLTEGMKKRLELMIKNPSKFIKTTPKPVTLIKPK